MTQLKQLKGIDDWLVKWVDEPYCESRIGLVHALSYVTYNKDERVMFAAWLKGSDACIDQVIELWPDLVGHDWWQNQRDSRFILVSTALKHALTSLHVLLNLAKQRVQNQRTSAEDELKELQNREPKVLERLLQKIDLARLIGQCGHPWPVELYLKETAGSTNPAWYNATVNWKQFKLLTANALAQEALRSRISLLYAYQASSGQTSAPVAELLANKGTKTLTEEYLKLFPDTGDSISLSWPA